MKIFNIMPNNEIEQYIKNLFDVFPEYKITDEDEKEIKKDKAQCMAKKLLLKKFRKAKVAEKTKEDIHQKVRMSIESNKPLYLIVCFGGYKHFWNSSFPEADWAELFNLAFMTEYAAPILKVHPPGVILDYESEDVIMPIIDNYPEEYLDIYAESFRKLISVYSKNLPANFKINYVRSQEQYDTSKMLARIKEMLPERIKNWRSLLETEREKRLHRTPKSIMWKGKEDWSHLSEGEKKNKMEISKIVNEIYYDADAEFRGEYFTGGNHIPIVLSWGLCEENIFNWLTLGSNRSSLVDFWIGRGIIEKRSDKIIPRIVSHKQYLKVKSKAKALDVSGANSLLGLKNFNQIEVYE